MINQFQINEELIGEDFETTVQAYLQRDIQMNLDPGQMIQKSLKKLGYDGNNLHFVNADFQNITLTVDVNYLQDIIDEVNIEKFYRYLPLDALVYIGY